MSPHPPPSSSIRISRQSISTLETSEHKVDATQTGLCRVREHAANVTPATTRAPCGRASHALATAERRQAGKERNDGDYLFSSVSSVSWGTDAEVRWRTFVRGLPGRPVIGGPSPGQYLDTCWSRPLSLRKPPPQQPFPRPHSTTVLAPPLAELASAPAVAPGACCITWPHKGASRGLQEPTSPFTDRARPSRNYII